MLNKFDFIQRSEEEIVRISPNHYKPRTNVFKGIEHKINTNCYGRFLGKKLIIDKKRLPNGEELLQSIRPINLKFDGYDSPNFKKSDLSSINTLISMDNSDDIGFLRISIHPLFEEIVYRDRKMGIVSKGKFMREKDDTLKLRLKIPKVVVNKDFYQLHIEVVDITKTQLIFDESYRVEQH